jgi:hypothetical protein
LFALPTWADRTNGHACSCSPPLLPTPTVQDGENTAGRSQFDRDRFALNVLVVTLPTD